MNWDTIDWRALARLRTAFLTGNAGQDDYWKSERDLADYDATYAQRIGWKWDHVLRDLRDRGWSPPSGEILDWGCGTGIASRRVLDCYGTDHFSRVLLADRSPLAMRFAAGKIRETAPTLDIWTETNIDLAVDTLLISHVLTELTADQLASLLSVVRQATCVIWVEPGTQDVSRRLIGIREELRPTFGVVAPCTHNQSCGLSAESNHRHWCHHFARVPGAVFTDRNWAQFGKLLGIDLRRLPVSYLVLDRRLPPAPASSDIMRVIGDPRIYKGYARLLCCAADGVRDCRLTRRRLPDSYQQARKGTLATRQRWREQDGEILEMKTP